MLPKNNGDEIMIDYHVLPTLVAVSQDEQQQGLMYQQWPPPIMTFPFAKKGVHKFWMKNTPCPLDIVFVSNGQIVAIEHGEPMSTQCVGPDKAVDMVVELPAGTCRTLGISAGQPVKPRFSLSTVARSVLQSGTLSISG